MASTRTFPVRRVRSAGRLSGARSTPASLRLRVLALLLCVAALWATMGLTFGGAHGAVSDADARAVPAVADTAQVGYFLADADRVAVESLLSGTMRLSGPGQRYQEDLKNAHQALAQAAEHDATGASGSGKLQTVEGLLVDYTSLVEQAHANAGQSVLAGAYLSYASRLMQAPDSGILARVEKLRRDERQAVDQHRQSPWLAPGVLLGVLAPAALGLALLVGTQRFLSRHFNRRLNPALLAGSLLLAGLAGWGLVQSLHTDRAFDSATAALDNLSGAWQARALAAQASAGDALAVVEGDPAESFPAGLVGYADQVRDLVQSDSAPTDQDTTAQVIDSLEKFRAANAEVERQAAGRDPAAAATVLGRGPAQLGGSGAALDAGLSRLTVLAQQRLGAAQSSAGAELGLGPGLPLLSVTVAGLCLLGLWPRIDEYRGVR
ncbi:hypothetical protein [Kitasatospora azatica]|uniref:hypothetical protein n=1 Tax=Kitasatospora azatica TaxID=58347 RepID=UPI0005634669|nr:hypothetical protein [Kitasatospora azatica]